MSKKEESSIFSEGFSTKESDYKKIEKRLYKTNMTNIVTSAEIDAVEDDDYFALAAKLKASIAKGTFKDMDKLPEAIMRAKYLYKMAWSAGMTTAEVQDYVSRGLDAYTLGECKQILAEARKLLYAEVSDINPSEVFRAYVERARTIIKRMEDMSDMIRMHWKTYGFNPGSFQKEYAVLMKMMFDAEKEILKLGIDLGTIKSKEAADNMVFNVLNLVPDKDKAKEQRVKMIEDSNGNEAS